MAWDYKREERKFDIVPEGDHRIRIKSADRAVSKNGNDMLALQFEVSGMRPMLYHYIVFLPDRPEITNRMLTQFFDSFKGIEDGDFVTNHWEGQVGACHVRHEEYNGDKTARIQYFINANRQDDLPAWREPDGTEVDENGFMKVPEGSDIDDLF